ncbi:autotransporter domain-containing protein [Martelella lutilitoris]|nr:autotransporter domain-containing protein [Martelella lutilitoris]
MGFDRLEFQAVTAMSPTGYVLLGGAGGLLTLSPYSSSSGTLQVDNLVTATIGVNIQNGQNNANAAVSTLEKTGGGTLVFTGTKTYTGTTTISGGTLQLGDGTTNGGVDGNISVGASGTLVFNASPTLGFSTIVDSNGSTTAAMRVIGTGTVNFLSPSTNFAGTTTVESGTLNVMGTLGGNVDVTGGTLMGTGTIGGNVSVTGGTLSGTVANATPLAISGTLTLNPGSSLSVTLNATANTAPLITVDTLNLQGGTVMYMPTMLTDIGQHYNLIRYTTFDPAGSLGNLTLQNPMGQNYSLGNDGTFIYIIPESPVGQGAYWHPQTPPGSGNFGGPGSWTASGGQNWSNSQGQSPGPWTQSANAIFQGALSAAITVDSSAPILVNGLTFDTTGYSLISRTGQADVLTLNANGASVDIAVNAAMATIAVGMIDDGMTASPVTKTGVGTLVLTADNQYTGATTVSQGTLQLGDGTTNGSINRASTITVNPNATLTIMAEGTSTVTINNMLASGAGGGTAPQFNIGGTGTVSLNSLNRGITGFTGQTTVQSGATLTGNNGSIGGTTTVSDGAFLSGIANQPFGMDNLVLTDGIAGSSGSVIRAAFQAPAATPLFDASGDLTLGGLVNVTNANPVGGELGDGAYYLISYGNLTNSIDDLKIDVNSTGIGVNSQDVTVSMMTVGMRNIVAIVIGEGAQSYWNGSRDSGLQPVVGGNGRWTASSTDRNWTDSSGHPHGPWNQKTVAVFEGSDLPPPAVVTIDSSAGAGGAITVAGLSFAVDGYTLSGPQQTDALTLFSDFSDNLSKIEVRQDFTATLDVDLTGTAGIRKAGTGTLILNGDKTFSGGTRVAQGILQIGSTAGGGAVLNDISVDSTATLSLFAQNMSTLVFTNALSGVAGANLAIGGTGTVDFQSTSATNFTGATTVATGATLMSTSGGGIGGAVTVQGGATLSGAQADPTFTVGAGSLTLTDSMSMIIVSLNAQAPGNTPLFSVGDFHFDNGGTITVDVLNGADLPLNNHYVLFQYSGSRTTDLTLLAFAPGTNPNYHLQQQGTNQIVLAVTAPGDNFWNPGQTTVPQNLGGSGGWTADRFWSDSDSNPVPAPHDWTQGATAIFERNDGTVTVDSSGAAINVGGMTFTGVSYDINPNAAVDQLTLAPAGSNAVTVDVDTSGQTATINTILAGNAGLTKTGAGTLVLTADNQYTGETTVSAGTLVIGGSRSLPAGINLENPGATLEVNTNGPVTFGAANVISGTASNANFNIASGTVALNSNSGNFGGTTTVQGNTTLTGHGTLGGSVFIEGGGTISGSVNGGALTAGTQLTLVKTGSTASILAVELHETANASAVIQTGQLFISGATLQVTIDNGPALNDGTYPLIAYATRRLGELSLIAASGIATVNDVYYRLKANEMTPNGPGQIDLLVGEDAYLYWNGLTANPGTPMGAGGRGTWTMSNQNWTDAQGSPPGEWGSGGYGVFGGNAGGPVTVVSPNAPDNVIAVSGMQFTANGYTLAASSTQDVLNLVPQTSGADAEIDVVNPSGGGTTTATIDVPLIGSSGLNKKGDGTLILAGDNNYDGETTVSAGTLTSVNENSVPHDISIASAATWSWNVTTDATFGGVISDAVAPGGTFDINAGSGNTLTLTGASDQFSGTTNITSGLLFVPANAALGGTINVMGGARLTAKDSSLGSVHVAANGSMIIGSQTPVASTGTVTLDILDVDSSATLTFIMDYAGNMASQIVASGSVTIATGANVSVSPISGHLELGDEFVLIQATGNITWTETTTFSDNGVGGLIQVNPLNNHQLIVTATTSRNRLDCSAHHSACLVLDNVGGDLRTLLRELEDDGPTLLAALDQLSGSIYASSDAAMIANSRYLSDTTGRQVRAALGGIADGRQASAVSNYAAAPAVETPFGTFEETNSGIGVWATGYGSWSKLDGTAGSAALTDSVGGTFIGVDVGAFGSMRFGGVFGYGQSTYEVEGQNAKGSSDDYTLGLYGGGQWGGWGTDFGAAYTWHDISTSRSIDFSAFSDRISGSYDAGTFQVYGSFGYTFDMGDNFRLEPYADASYIHQTSDGFTETGGPAAFSRSASEMNTGFTTVGLRGAWDIPLGDYRSQLTGSAGWRHAYGDIDPTAALRFNGGDVFNMSGAPLAEDQAVFSVGWTTDFSENVSVGVSYTGQFGGGYKSQNLTGQIQIKF